MCMIVIHVTTFLLSGTESLFNDVASSQQEDSETTSKFLFTPSRKSLSLSCRRSASDRMSMTISSVQSVRVEEGNRQTIESAVTSDTTSTQQSISTSVSNLFVLGKFRRNGSEEKEEDDSEAEVEDGERHFVIPPVSLDQNVDSEGFSALEFHLHSMCKTVCTCLFTCMFTCMCIQY